jgi:signal transduction histidine kinase
VFRGLRLRLTLLYTLAAATLVFLMSLVAYAAIEKELQAGVDLALRYRMAQQLQWQGFDLPDELRATGEEWQARQGKPVGPSGVVALAPEEDSESEAEDDDVEDTPRDLDEFDADLAPVFVLSSASQTLRAVGERQNAPLDAPYAPAAEAALTLGQDLRTVTLADGARVRLLTYRLPGAGPDQVIQVGRLLDDQQRVLDALVRVLAVLGGVGALLIAAASWWVAGRTIAPAQSAWEKQQAFVANASHELRAPLTVVRASAEVARRGPGVTDAQRALLDDILDEVDHMSRLVEDQLLLSRLDAGQLRLTRERIDLEGLLGDVGRKFSRLATEHQVELQIDVVGAPAIAGDPTRLRQVLLILLDNALRHTPGGGRITLSSCIEGKRAAIVVADTGRGIPPEDLPHVFERFYRSSQAGDADGSGLGLAIARGLTEALGGNITLQAEPGRGTRARMSFPLA